MKMINAGTANIQDYPNHSRNCNLGCKRPYMAPIPSLDEVQLYVNFGAIKPTATTFTIIDLCTPTNTAVATSGLFVIGWTGEYWYGVFRGFTSTLIPATFIIALQTATQTFFSEQYAVETSCETLTKISVCYPAGFNAEDPNGIYVGAPSMNQPSDGNYEVFYQHEFWTRQGEIIEVGNKVVFIQNFKRNFASTLNKSFEFRPELLPGWYKDYLLSVYFRGNILINDTPAMVTDLNFEDVDNDYWKAYAVLGKETKGAFGCSPFKCVEPGEVCCNPVLVSSEVYEDEDPVTLRVIFTPCEPTPADGYHLKYRPAGTFGAYTDGGNFSTSPIELATAFPAGTEVEGILRSNCGDGLFGKDIKFNTGVSCYPVTFVTIAMGDAHVGVLFEGYIQLTGTPPFTIHPDSVPAWVTTLTITGNQVNVKGTPTAEATDEVISFWVRNCIGGEQKYEGTMDTLPTCEEYLNDNLGRTANLSWTDCDGTVHSNEDVGQNQSICIQSGSGSGGDFGFLRYLGDCY